MTKIRHQPKFKDMNWRAEDR